MNMQEVISTVQGATKEELQALQEAINSQWKANRELERARAQAVLSTDDRVELEGLRPKKLNGVLGTIHRWNKGRTRCDVKVIDGYLSGYAKNDLIHGVPVTCCKQMPKV